MKRSTVHIGEVIRQKVKERGISVVDFANAIHCTRSHVYTIYSRKNMDVEQLMLISKALGYDLISEIYLSRPALKKYLVLLEVDELQLRTLSALPVKFVRPLSE
ncbi:MAG: helix-turn-helix domain-containing protein [Prevotellaceae bacterium]|jgi:transcriptional regulator with XRE-family HTH domain|nr:helix-turn-helix domain-containing protein [Prevotellaceae bacterium]